MIEIDIDIDIVKDIEGLGIMIWLYLGKIVLAFSMTSIYKPQFKSLRGCIVDKDFVSWDLAIAFGYFGIGLGVTIDR